MNRLAMREIDQADTWNSAIRGLSYAHVLQTYEWGEVKARFGWQARRFIWEDGHNVRAAAMVLERAVSIPGIGFKLFVQYVSKGPLLADWKDRESRRAVVEDLQDYARKRKAIFIKIDPDVAVKFTVPDADVESPDPKIGEEVAAELQASGWVYSSEQIQFRNTMILDLSLSEDELLRQMKQKTRYNIRLAQRKGVSVRVGNPDDIPMLYHMYAQTAKRDGFTIRDKNYYTVAWGTFMEPRTGLKNAGMPQTENEQHEQIPRTSAIPMAEVLIAEVADEPIAAVIFYRFAAKAWYLFGMSADVHREKMPNYLLQWEAIRRAKAGGCTLIDLWGAPEVFDESDSLYGVYRFKAGFGSVYVRHIGAWDYPVRGTIYHLYMEILPKILGLMRRLAGQRIGKETTSL